MHGSFICTLYNEFIIVALLFKRSLGFFYKKNFFLYFWTESAFFADKSRTFNGENALTRLNTKFKFSWKCVYSQGQNHQIKPLNSFLWVYLFTFFIVEIYQTTQCDEPVNALVWMNRMRWEKRNEYFSRFLCSVNHNRYFFGRVKNGCS